MYKKIYKDLCLKKARKIAGECDRYVIGSLLDVGAGRGFIAQEIQRRKQNKVQCLDVKNLNLTKLPLKVYDGKKIPYKKNSFDTVLLCYVLHHTEDPVHTLKECKRVAKKRIIIFEDNAASFFTKFFDIVFNKLHGVDTPLNFKTPKEWLSIFNKLNLNLVKMKRGVEKQWFYPGVEHIMFVVEV